MGQGSARAWGSPPCPGDSAGRDWGQQTAGSAPGLRLGHRDRRVVSLPLAALVGTRPRLDSPGRPPGPRRLAGLPPKTALWGPELRRCLGSSCARVAICELAGCPSGPSPDPGCRHPGPRGACAQLSPAPLGSLDFPPGRVAEKPAAAGQAGYGHGVPPGLQMAGGGL